MRTVSEFEATLLQYNYAVVGLSTCAYYVLSTSHHGPCFLYLSCGCLLAVAQGRRTHSQCSGLAAVAPKGAGGI